jgi:hypothetical protein
MSLQQTIKSQIIDAMKAKDAVRLETLRGLSAQFTNELVSLKRKPQDELSDEEALKVITRAVKQRKDSIEQFEKGGRADLADKEKLELAVLEPMLPAMMDKTEVMQLAEIKKTELGVTSKADAGKLMSALMKDLKGKADGTTVKEVVDELLK